MSYLRALRRSRALTFLDLARLTGIPARLLAEAEYGLRSLSRNEREQLALVFGLPDQNMLQPAYSVRGQSRAATLALPLPSPQALLIAALAGTLALSATQPPLRWTGSLPVTAPRPPAVAATPPAQSLPTPPETTDLALSAQQAQAVAAISDELAQLIQAIAAQVARYPTASATAAPPPAFVLSASGPLGCPLQAASGQVVLTQGYGVGSHAPAAIWGAVDLAVDGDGDGLAEPAATWNVPVVATHAGIVRATPDSWPGGNHIWVEDAASGWRSGYAHLSQILVASGQEVSAGTIIGLVGSSGMASGPHLDYQVWYGDRNIDPTLLVSGCS